MSIKTKVDFDTFAFNIGVQSGLTRAASLPLSVAFHNADEEQQRNLRIRWMTNHIRGSLKVNAKTAERILSEGKGEACKSDDNRGAIDKASSDFRYHIIRKDEQSADKPNKSMRISRQHREWANDFIAHFEGKDKTAQINAAIALLRAMK